MNLRKYPINRFASASVKLFLYISIASLSSLLSDFSRYSDDVHVRDVHDMRWLTIAVNAIVQGLIAWRAFIDGSVERIQEKERVEEKLEHIHTHL